VCDASPYRALRPTAQTLGIKLTVTYSYREARGSEKAELFQLYCQVMKENIEQIWGWDQQWQENDFAKHYEPKNITVACTKAELVGYAQIEHQKETLFIRMLLLAPKHQRKGVGAQLLSKILHLAAAQSLGVRLRVFKINKEAKRFYEHQGFQVTGETPESLVMEFNA
jgi:ribosomal protein S18 acetylase RimI-like enzyme